MREQMTAFHALYDEFEEALDGENERFTDFAAHIPMLR